MNTMTHQIRRHEAITHDRLYASVTQPDLLIAPPKPQPVQEGFDL